MQFLWELIVTKTFFLIEVLILHKLSVGNISTDYNYLESPEVNGPPTFTLYHPLVKPILVVNMATEINMYYTIV